MAASATNTNDSLLTFKYIYSICTPKPHTALELLNKAEKQKALPQYLIDQLRCFTYSNGLSMYRTALIYAQKTMQSDSIQKYPYEMMTMAIAMAVQYNLTSNHKESIRWAIKGIEVAQSLNEKGREAYLLLTIGKNKWEMGLKDEAVLYINRSIKMQEQAALNAKDYATIDDLIFSYGTRITYAMKEGDYQTAIDLLPAYEKQMKRMEKCADVPEGVCDMRYASGYAAYAYIFACNGQPEQGRQYYRKFLETDFSATHIGQTMGIKYLLAVKKYKDALQSISAEKKWSRELGDTINDEYLHGVLEYEAQAYSGLGNDKATAESYRQMYVIADSINSREKQNVALELATIYETNEKEAQIQKQTADLKQRNIWIVSLTGMVFLMLVLLVCFLLHIKAIKKKNIALVKRFDETLLYKEELQRVQSELRNLNSAERPDTTNEISDGSDPEEEPSAPQESNRKLFDQLNQTIINEKLYLNAELIRDDLAQIIHVNKNRFARIIQENTGMRLTEYLNELRLNHSIQLLKEYPNYTLQAIAHDSGFSNMGTFHRLFKEKVGMTPSEYKSISQKLE